MNVLQGVSVDNGGSESRILACDATVENIIHMDNDFMTIRENDFRVKDVAEPAKLIRVLEAPKDEYKGIIAQGNTGRAYESQLIDISSQSAKTSNINYYKQFIFVIAQEALSEWIKNGGYSKFSIGEEFSQFTVDNDVLFKYAIVACIPIKEFNGATDCAGKLRDMLAGEYKVEFPLLENKPVIKFSIDKKYIGVVPEGGVAIMSMKKEISPEDISLVIDMGHVTTDIALFQGTSLLGKVASSKYAGSTLVANLRMALEDEGYILSESQVQKAISTREVKVGKNTIDITDIVNRQIQDFVKNYLKKDIISVLNMNKFNAQQVQNLVPIGAPMNNPASNTLVAEIIHSCGFENAEVKVLADDLRYVNVQQANKFARALLKSMRM